MNQLDQFPLLPAAQNDAAWALAATYEKEERPIRPVITIEVNGAVKVVVFRADSLKLVVAGEDQEAIRNTKTTVDGHRLIIEKKDYVRKRRFSWLFRQKPTPSRVIVGISLPEATTIRLNGSGDMKLYDIQQSSLELFVCGSGSLQAFGQIDHLTAEVNGSGAVKTNELVTLASQLSVEGSGRIDAQGGFSVNASVAGSGSIRSRGTSLVRKQSVTGSGSIKFTEK